MALAPSRSSRVRRPEKCELGEGRGGRCGEWPPAGPLTAGAVVEAVAVRVLGFRSFNGHLPKKRSALTA